MQAVKDNFKLFGGGEEEVTDVQVEHFINCVRSSKQKILLQQPRRGEWTLRHPNDVYICYAAVFVLLMQLMALLSLLEVCALPCLSPKRMSCMRDLAGPITLVDVANMTIKSQM